jgi:hypothetical protein
LRRRPPPEPEAASKPSASYTSRDAGRFHLEVKLDDGGAWEVNNGQTIIDTDKTVAGHGGATFDEAWHGMRPTEG